MYWIDCLIELNCFDFIAMKRGLCLYSVFFLRSSGQVKAAAAAALKATMPMLAWVALLWFIRDEESNSQLTLSLLSVLFTDLLLAT